MGFLQTLLRRQIPQLKRDEPPKSAQAIQRILQLSFMTLVAYLVAWPIPIRPIAWQANTTKPGATLWPNTDWSVDPTYVDLPEGYGPEDVAIDSAGVVHVGLNDGRIMTFTPPDWQPQEIANTGGRPLGLHFDMEEAFSSPMPCVVYYG